MSLPPGKRHRAGDGPSSSTPCESSRVGMDIIVLEPPDSTASDWPVRATAAFNAAHAATGVWPAAVHVRGAALPHDLDVLTHPRLWDALAARCGGNTHATVHDLDATRGQSATLHLSLSLWAELCRYRAAEARTSAAPPSPPAGVGKAQWTAVLSGAHRLYLSAFEAQVHAPELAASFNSLVEPVCTLRHVPGAHDNLGPIIMHADAGASSGWHRDGTSVRGAPFRGGDVNAFHVHFAGVKTWSLFPPACSAAVADALHGAPRNAFGNLVMTPAVADQLARDGIAPVVLESCGGDVVLVGKHAWHCVDTCEASVSLASDRLFTDQLGALAATLTSLDDRPLTPAKWAVRALSARLSSAILHGTAHMTPMTRSILAECATFLDAQDALEPTVDCSKLFDAPPCVSCDRPHARLRYCHACGAEVYNLLFVCDEPECAFEACGACGRAHQAMLSGAAAADGACAHASLSHEFLHFLPKDHTVLKQRVRVCLAAAAHADDGG